MVNYPHGGAHQWCSEENCSEGFEPCRFEWLNQSIW